MSTQKNKNVIDFVTCPNHDTNFGSNLLRFLGGGKIKCDLCKKEFTLDEIREEIRRTFAIHVSNLQHAYAQDLQSLYDNRSTCLDKINALEKTP